ncbi:MAG: ABC transporter ATP-binding protein [archaeon]
MRDDAAVSLDGVTVKFGDVVALDGVNLTIYENDFLGIIGPNGAGKTTIFKVILGLIRPSSGDVRIYGRSPLLNRSMIGYVPQHCNFDRQFPASVLDTVMMGRMGKGLFKRFDDEDRRIALDALKTVGVHDLWDRKVGELSGGQVQRVLVARALATEPKILLLDEPTASVDTSVESGFYELLLKLNKRMTIVLVSHDIGAISVYVNKIACVNQKLFYHDDKEITSEVLSKTYKCPVELIAHGVPHRVLDMHQKKKRERK